MDPVRFRYWLGMLQATSYGAYVSATRLTLSNHLFVSGCIMEYFLQNSNKEFYKLKYYAGGHGRLL
jgi:hypothetical protein